MGDGDTLMLLALFETEDVVVSAVVDAVKEICGVEPGLSLGSARTEPQAILHQRGWYFVQARIKVQLMEELLRRNARSDLAPLPSRCCLRVVVGEQKCEMELDVSSADVIQRTLTIPPNSGELGT